MKISFSLPSNASSSKPINSSTSLHDDQENSDTLNKATTSIEYVHEFTVSSNVDRNPTIPRVIPPIPNEWELGKKQIIIESKEAVLKEELKRRHEHHAVNKFENNPVEGFGAALLARYGWQPRRGIGKNATEDVSVVEFRANVSRKGLGF